MSIFSISLHPMRDMKCTSRRRTDKILIRSQQPRSGQTLQQERKITMVDDAPAAGHRPQILYDATLCSVELQKQLLEPELRDGRELTVELGFAARLEPRHDADLPFTDPSII